jgi:Condensation domain
MFVPFTTIQPEASTSVVRPLGSLEQLFYLLDQVSPTHFAVTAQIKGRTRIVAWRAALDSLQLRHPLFSVCIDIDEESKPYFRHVADAPIPLRVMEGRVPSDWESEIEKELALPFQAETAPLVPAVLLHDTNEAVFTLTAHHSIADGMSLSYAIRDTLRALSGQSIKRLPVLPPQEELFGRIDRTAMASTREAPDEYRSGPPAVYRKRDDSRPRIHRLALTAETSRRLRERSREEGTTVHGALCAALLLAGR